MTSNLCKVICAWCLWTIREGFLIDGKASHGCCDKCKAKLLTPDEVLQLSRERSTKNASH